jgi:hypothetical protein
MGIDTLVDGVSGRGWDVLRGIIATDAFHATPAVFQVRALGRRHVVAAGTPLVRLVPVPRALAGQTPRLVGWPDALPEGASDTLPGCHAKCPVWAH